MSLFVDVITGGSSSHQTTSEAANYFATDFVAAGVVGTIGNTGGVGPCTGAFGVSAQASPNTTVQINTGVIYVQATPTGQGSQMLRVKNTATINQSISANTSGSTKYDWIYVSIDPTNANNPDAAADNVASIVVSRSSSNTADNGTPPAYGTLIAVVTVANGFSSITNGNISDRRAVTSLSTNSTITNGWSTINATLTYAGNNGNKEYLINTSVDLSGILSPGMRLKVGRGVTVPTQCMSFSSASSQYATKANPAGITFTGPFTAEAWIYVNSYTGQTQNIISRYDSAFTSGGWAFQLTPTGQVYIFYGTTTLFSDQRTNQSLPLQRWMHVAAVVTSVASKTFAIYINGQLATSTAINTAATSLTQAAVDLRVGAASATPANTYFNGYISELRVWSTNQSQANIQANMGINLTGTETNLVALYQGNGNFNDATSNANNLTATNGAIATQAANPYNSTEYAIITKVTSSQLTVFTGSDYNIPNMALLVPQYSIVKIPYGFPPQASKWSVLVLNSSPTLASPAGASTYINDKSLNIVVPTGAWKLGFEGMVVQSNSVSALYAPYGGLSTSNNSASDQDLIAGIVMRPGSTTSSSGWLKRDKDIMTTSATTYYLIVAYQVGGGTVTVGFDGTSNAAGMTVLRAVSGYL